MAVRIVRGSTGEARHLAFVRAHTHVARTCRPGTIQGERAPDGCFRLAFLRRGPEALLVLLLLFLLFLLLLFLHLQLLALLLVFLATLVSHASSFGV